MTQPGEGTSHRWTAANSLLAVLAAFFTVLSAFLGLRTAQVTNAKERAQASAADKSKDLATLQAQYDDLKHQYNQAQADNRQLRSQLGLPSPTASPQAASSATVRRRGQLVMADLGPSIDLDSPASDPQWQSGDSDLRYFNGMLSSSFSTTVLYLGDVKADYAKCRNRTGCSSRSYEIDSLAVGQYLCYRTNDKRHAAMKITELTKPEVAFDVVVYDPPDS